MILQQPQRRKLQHLIAFMHLQESTPKAITVRLMPPNGLILGLDSQPPLEHRVGKVLTAIRTIPNGLHRQIGITIEHFQC